MGSKVKAKIENSLMRVRAREDGFPSPHSFLHPPFVFVEKVRCFSRIVVEYFRKIAVFGGEDAYCYRLKAFDANPPMRFPQGEEESLGKSGFTHVVKPDFALVGVAFFCMSYSL